MNKKAEAWNEFLMSERGQEGSNPETLKAPLSQRQFLENRMFWAFTAGWDSAENSQSVQGVRDET